MTPKRKALAYKWLAIFLLIVPCVVATLIRGRYSWLPDTALALAWGSLFACGVLVFTRFEKIAVSIKHEEEQERLRQYRESSLAERKRRSAAR